MLIAVCLWKSLCVRLLFKLNHLSDELFWDSTDCISHAPRQRLVKSKLIRHLASFFLMRPCILCLFSIAHRENREKIELYILWLYMWCIIKRKIRMPQHLAGSYIIFLRFLFPVRLFIHLSWRIEAARCFESILGARSYRYRLLHTTIRFALLCKEKAENHQKRESKND